MADLLPEAKYELIFDEEKEGEELYRLMSANEFELPTNIKIEEETGPDDEEE